MTGLDGRAIGDLKKKQVNISNGTYEHAKEEAKRKGYDSLNQLLQELLELWLAGKIERIPMEKKYKISN